MISETSSFKYRPSRLARREGKKKEHDLHAGPDLLIRMLHATVNYLLQMSSVEHIRSVLTSQATLLSHQRILAMPGSLPGFYQLLNAA